MRVLLLTLLLGAGFVLSAPDQLHQVRLTQAASGQMLEVIELSATKNSLWKYLGEMTGPLLEKRAAASSSLFRPKWYWFVILLVLFFLVAINRRRKAIKSASSTTTKK